MSYDLLMFLLISFLVLLLALDVSHTAKKVSASMK